MSDAGDGTLFDFSAIAETEIMKLSGELCLPYNPFSFDLILKIIKSKPSFESQSEFKIESGCKSVFGRNKIDVEYLLKAPTISGRHFMIDETKKIIDLGSTKGTFIWVPHSRPANLELEKIFLIGKT